MCGILCVFGCAPTAESYRTKVLDRARRIRHRGPDWSGTYLKGRAILQHERLSIVSPEEGHQPLLNDAKTLVLAVNGEIYNHVDIRNELTDARSKAQAAPHTWLTRSDCECIIHLYAEHGVDGMSDALNKLNGMWAFALYDAERDVHIVGRDHMGIIPLYYGHDSTGAMWVASELKALHDVCVTFQEFPPGHWYNSVSGQVERWYSPRWHDESWVPTTKVDAPALRKALEASVRRHMMSDVPYGVLLSGGLDSSIISAIVAAQSKMRVETNSQLRAHWPQLHSFSIGLAGSPDLAAAQDVANYIDTVHHSIEFTVEEGLNALSDVVSHIETYDVTTIRASTPMYLLARKIKTMGVKMVLSGEGADEIFAGYLYFHKAPDAKALHLETVHKLKSLHKFDCLRANKATAAWGIEARVPFLDKQFLDEMAMCIDPADKMCGERGDGKMEKWILRNAFEGMLPDKVLWRQKEQFSDGVGYSWIDSIKDHVDLKVTDDELAAAAFRYPVNTPTTKEAYFYRRCFETHFPESAAAACVPGSKSIACSTAAALEWDASFSQLADCSGRAVAGVHMAALDDQARSREMKRVAATAAAPDGDSGATK